MQQTTPFHFFAHLLKNCSSFLEKEEKLFLRFQCKKGIKYLKLNQNFTWDNIQDFLYLNDNFYMIYAVYDNKHHKIPINRYKLLLAYVYDIDITKELSNLEKEKIRSKIITALEQNGLMPDYFVFSGNGLHLIYIPFIEEAKATVTYSLYPFIGGLIKNCLSSIKNCHLDTGYPGHAYRIPGMLTKEGEPVLVYEGIPGVGAILLKLHHVPAWTKEKQFWENNRKIKRQKIESEIKKDLKKILKINNINPQEQLKELLKQSSLTVKEGQRNNAIFVYATICRKHELSLNKTKLFLEKYVLPNFPKGSHPYTTGEFLRTLKSVYASHHFYYRCSILSLLTRIHDLDKATELAKITEIEHKKLGLKKRFYHISVHLTRHLRKASITENVKELSEQERKNMITVWYFAQKVCKMPNSKFKKVESVFKKIITGEISNHLYRLLKAYYPKGREIKKIRITEHREAQEKAHKICLSLKKTWKRNKEEKTNNETTMAFGGGMGGIYHRQKTTQDTLWDFCQSHPYCKSPLVLRQPKHNQNNICLCSIDFTSLDNLLCLSHNSFFSYLWLKDLSQCLSIASYFDIVKDYKIFELERLSLHDFTKKSFKFYLGSISIPGSESIILYSSSSTEDPNKTERNKIFIDFLKLWQKELELKQKENLKVSSFEKDILKALNMCLEPNKRVKQVIYQRNKRYAKKRGIEQKRYLQKKRSQLLKKEKLKKGYTVYGTKYKRYPFLVFNKKKNEIDTSFF